MNCNVVLADFPAYPLAVSFFDDRLDPGKGAIEVEPGFCFSVSDGRVMETPFCFNDLDDASSMRTTSAPFEPQVRGARSFRILSRKCWHSFLSGSSCLMKGICMSP